MHDNPTSIASAMSEQRVLLTRREAAKTCGLCEKTLANHTAPRGRLVAVHVGRAVRYAPADLARWIETLKGGA